MHDLSPDEARRIVTEAHASKLLWDQDRPPESRFLQDKNAILLFEKPSLRTTSSLQTAIARHGGFSKFEEAGN
ncbi:MAG: Ornithine carbamoyltransferase, partial [Candidatus Peribacteria bacterium GW2011_GWC2_54_8]